ncbi:transcriptional regulator [Natrinema thermotolerans]|uniref:Transcriptional regulator n=1 Tax=Natrinema thermotolerans TaxID=121872 RepID=A0AAF0PCX9_9EURY|nr:hypothetical protein [Natrinema thermotolerans]QCC57831.1 transcriptional regulator [Natrinema thermotolerans]WMT08922.1 transcriptional regulator [Natrinema thermotolerans]
MVDDAFDALADGHRRRLLLSLLDHNPQDVSTVDGIPWEVAEIDEGLTQKYHVHLPKLADYGYIEWHREAGNVVKGPRFDEIRPLLELLENHRDELPDGWP